MDFGMQLLRLAGSFALVLAIFFAFIYALRRWGSRVRKPDKDPRMEVLSKQSFGPRHHLVLVKVPGDQTVLVGISPQNMNLITLSAPGPAAAPARETIETV